MARELTRNQRRLVALAASGLFWGALLVTVGFRLVHVVVVLGGLAGAAALWLRRRRLAPALRPWARRAGRVEALAREQGRELAASLRQRSARSEARRLNEQAAVLRQEGKIVQALEAGEQALEIFRTLGDRRGEALTLNGVGLTQARSGDEAGAIDSYETAVSLLTALGDSHGAGRVLANLGATHLGQGHDEQARAVWEDALERLEPGSPEHDRTAQRLRLAS